MYNSVLIVILDNNKLSNKHVLHLLICSLEELRMFFLINIYF